MKKKVRLKEKPSSEIAEYSALKENLEVQTALAELKIAKFSLRKMRQSHRLQKLIHARKHHLRGYVV